MKTTDPTLIPTQAHRVTRAALLVLFSGCAATVNTATAQPPTVGVEGQLGPTTPTTGVPAALSPDARAIMCTPSSEEFRESVASSPEQTLNWGLAILSEPSVDDCLANAVHAVRYLGGAAAIPALERFILATTPRQVSNERFVRLRKAIIAYGDIAGRDHEARNSGTAHLIKASNRDYWLKLNLTWELPESERDYRILILRETAIIGLAHTKSPRALEHLEGLLVRGGDGIDPRLIDESIQYLRRMPGQTEAGK